MVRSRRKWIAVIIGIALIGLLAAVALASPGSRTTSATLVTVDFARTVHMNSNRVKFETKDATDLRVQRIDFAPGGLSGCIDRLTHAAIEALRDTQPCCRKDGAVRAPVS